MKQITCGSYKQTVYPDVIHLSRLLHFVRNDGGSRTSLRGNAVTAAIYSELHNQRIEQAVLFIQTFAPPSGVANAALSLRLTCPGRPPVAARTWPFEPTAESSHVTIVTAIPSRRLNAAFFQITYFYIKYCPV
jgi:hypothetical protein